MAPKNSMNRGLANTNPQSHPNAGNGVVSGDPQMTLQLSGGKTISGHIDDLYKSFQSAVAAYGGTVALAASMERPVPGVSLRVRHEKDSKGDVQNATLDMLGHVVADSKARELFLFELASAWGYKQPERIAEPTTDEKYRALMAVLRGAAGEAVLDAAAKAGDFDPGSFRR